MINMKSRPREYHQVARAAAARETLEAAQRAAVALWRERDFDDVTLADIAERAGVTVQTLLRRFGSKQGLLERCLEDGASDVRELRDQAPVGDVPGSLRTLMAHYERDGDAVVRTLRLEGRSEVADRIVAHGRQEHRRWCARVFGPFLPAEGQPGHDARLDAFVAATDIYLWKLWRRDLGYGEARTLAAWEALLGALASASPDGGR